MKFNPDPDQGRVRLGGQVDVLVFTSEQRGFLKMLGKWRIRIVSWLSYVR